MNYFLAGGWKNLVNDNVVDKTIKFEQTGIGNVLNMIRILGTGIALIMLTWMTFSYFMSDGKSFPGNVERKADIKGNQLIKFAIGAGIFIGASNILYWIAILIKDIVVAMVN